MSDFEGIKAMRISRSAPFSSVLALCWLVFLSCNTHAKAQQATEPQGTPFKIEVDVTKVLVTVVIRDKQGHSVGDLKKEDFQVFDNNKQRLLSAFTVERHGETENNSGSGSLSQAESGATPQSTASAQRFIVFLFDDMHLSAQDMARSKEAADALLSGSLAGSDIAAVVSISGKINSGLTRDRTKLLGAIASLQPQILYRHNSSDCPNIDYYQADLMENKHDNTAIQDAVSQVMSCNPRTPPSIAESLAESAARQALVMGQQDVQITLSTIGEIVRRMATLPGQRTLILVSPGFLNSDPAAMAAESRIIDFAAQSDVTISALDARGLYTTALTAGDDTQGSSVLSKSQFRASSMKAVENVMAEFANGTGGTFFHNSNDLSAGFKGLTNIPEYIYILELPIDNVKHNGAYHRLNVKVDRNGLQVQARRGYILPKPAKGKK